jgi:hypothetical protein
MKQKINQLKNTKMKWFFIICLIAIGTTYAQEITTDQKVGEMTFETTEIDYGAINQNANGERLFSFKNTGDAPIVITQVRSSCGCTVPSYSKEPILPGETSEITVKYATNRVGVFKKTITVMSNAKEPQKTLYIKGNVLSPSK